DGVQRMALEDLARAARTAAKDNPRASLVIDADPTAPVTVSAGRETAALLNPHTGATINDASAASRGFFRTMENWHRWLGGDPRSLRAGLLDYANLLFLFITVSGLYLWLPAVWRWRTVKGVLLFQRRYINAKVRDFNWHHVFGAWMLVPLFVIALSGVVMSFTWANNAVYAAFGEQPPQRGGPPGGPGGPGPGGPGAGAPRADAAADSTDRPRASLQQLFDAAIAQVPEWQRVTLPLSARGARVDITVELKSGEQRAPRRTVVLDAADGRLIEMQGANAPAASAGQKARVWFRFAHTGEQYGIIGQTVAGIASLAACFLVYTGLALAWRRLIVPVFRRSTAS
ncbi:MAG TPA: PepSY-associated TM helix domain-containing protein, partial [Steroidobacteraceae bacterium]|nr:PepSY-associated TM helix domain-containing protein [Steroidobacteraceae bacterium]